MARDNADTDGLHLFGSGVADNVADEFRADAPMAVWGPHGEPVQVGCCRVGLLEGHTSGMVIIHLVEKVCFPSLEIGHHPFLRAKGRVFGVVFPGEVELLRHILVRFTDNRRNQCRVFCGGRDDFHLILHHFESEVGFLKPSLI
jgi:hypothetical protein